MIPCRKQYDIFPDLWSKKIDGKSLLSYAIDKCVASPILDNIVVTSDNPETEAALDMYNDSRIQFIHRPTDLTVRSRSIANFEHIIKELDLDWNGMMALSYIESPFSKTENIEEAIYTLIMNEADSAFAVRQFNSTVYRRTPHGLVPINNMDYRIISDFDILYSQVKTELAARNKNFKAEPHRLENRILQCPGE